MTKQPFRISLSITDFSPLFFDLGYLFKRLKATGIDGIELVLGIKSRWNAKQIYQLSQKYDLPVVSLHQPPWSGLGIWLDEGFIELAQVFGARTITCHPLPFLSLSHPKMQKYLARLSHLQEKKGVAILLENFPEDWLGIDTVDTNDIEKMIQVVQQYGLKITLDTDHLGLAAPQKELWFPKLIPYLGNVHLSSFTKKYRHMPLYLGDFQTKDFLEALKQADYKGLLTFEFQYPRLVTWFNYDTAMIKKSVELVKSI